MEELFNRGIAHALESQAIRELKNRVDELQKLDFKLLYPTDKILFAIELNERLIFMATLHIDPNEHVYVSRTLSTIFYGQRPHGHFWSLSRLSTDSFNYLLQTTYIYAPAWSASLTKAEALWLVQNIENTILLLDCSENAREKQKEAIQHLFAFVEE